MGQTLHKDMIMIIIIIEIMKEIEMIKIIKEGDQEEDSI